MLTAVLLKLAIGALGSVALGLVKSFAPQVWERVPEVIRPLLSSILGAIATGGTSLATDAAAGAAEVVVDAVVGAGGGALGKAVRDAGKVTTMYQGGNE